MSKQLMRSQFEEWMIREFDWSREALERAREPGDGGYTEGLIQVSWVSWQASRATVQVELPSASAYEGLTQDLGCFIELSYEKPEHDPVALVRLPDVVTVIEACGLKVKEIAR